jgi:hypothetical protein
MVKACSATANALSRQFGHQQRQTSLMELSSNLGLLETALRATGAEARGYWPTHRRPRLFS